MAEYQQKLLDNSMIFPKFTDAILFRPIAKSEAPKASDDNLSAVSAPQQLSQNDDNSPYEIDENDFLISEDEEAELK